MDQLTAVIRPEKAPVHYFRGGAGAPLLYLHHIAGLQGWEPAIAELATRFDVIAPYHPGWGPSEGIDEIDDGLGFVLHYIDFLDHLGLEQVHVLGHSIGAWIAAEIAAISPGRVKKLVLANPVGIWQESLGGENPFAQDPARATEILFADPARRDHLILRDGAVDPLENAVQETKDLKAAAKFLSPLPDTAVIKRLPRIKAHTIVVTGARDRFVPPAYGQVWRDQIEWAEAKTILDAGHLANLEQPNRFATITGSWFMAP
jgi:pimeloyl-ACP methyl ester carboxylesterase